MGIEPTSVWFTARCVNPFTTTAKGKYYNIVVKASCKVGKSERRLTI